jgi:hypothetical protein
MTIPVDALVRGRVGTTERTDTMRVYRVSPWGWVAGVNGDRRQRIMGAGTFEVVEGPRPEKERTDIPAHLRTDVRRASS